LPPGAKPSPLCFAYAHTAARHQRCCAGVAEGSRQRYRRYAYAKATRCIILPPKTAHERLPRHTSPASQPAAVHRPRSLRPFPANDRRIDVRCAKTAGKTGSSRQNKIWQKARYPQKAHRRQPSQAQAERRIAQEYCRARQRRGAGREGPGDEPACPVRTKKPRRSMAQAGGEAPRSGKQNAAAVTHRLRHVHATSPLQAQEARSEMPP